MGKFDMSPEQVAQYRQQSLDEAAGHVGDEQVIAAAGFRRGGSAASYAASKAGGGLPYLLTRLVSKKQAGGLPQHVMLAVTPTKVYAFQRKAKGSGMKISKEVAVWDRAGLKVSTDSGMGMTKLIIESPAEGEKVTLVGASVQDDPVSLEVIDVLQSGATSAPAAT